jgi:alcohol dehydrogenase class IV
MSLSPKSPVSPPNLTSRDEHSPRTSEFMTTTNPAAADGDQTRSDPVLLDISHKTRLVFGRGSSATVGRLASKFAVQRVLLVTDHGLRDAGHSQHAVQCLKQAGLDVRVFDDVHENPTTADVMRCVEFARPNDIQLIVGLGGGSSMDCAKGCNFLLTNGGQMIDYRGIGKATQPMLPMIAVPTTSGTGSEAQSFAVIADTATHMKMACGDAKAACRIAVLDPDLTVTMPRGVAAATGIDAITHAIESYVTTRRNPISQMYSARAWRLLSDAFPKIMNDPRDIVARGNMQLGAFLAGSAIECSMLGAAHAASNPLSAHFGIVHGVAVGLMLPHVIRWNALTVSDLYHDLSVAAGWSETTTAHGTSVNRLADGFAGLLALADMPDSLTGAMSSMPDDGLVTRLAEEASTQWTGTFNPRRMDAEAFVQLYRNAM